MDILLIQSVESHLFIFVISSGQHRVTRSKLQQWSDDDDDDDRSIQNSEW